MRKSLSLITFAVLGASMMYGQASRTWVSGVGDDANPCSRTAPCKTWAGAISKTAAGGEIDALDPAGFGAVTITKSITLDGGGGQVASVLVAGTNGIVVQAGASDVVTLRNLRINGLLNSGNAGLNGIRFLAGKALNVETCVIFGFSQNGIDISLNQGTQAFAHIVNTTVNNVSGDGIRIANAVTPTVIASLDNVEVSLAAIGIEGAQHSRTTIRNSYIHSNSQQGVKADDVASSDAILEINDSIVNGNLFGDAIQASTGSTVVAGRMTVFFNGGCGFNGTAGGSVNWWQNTNQMAGNSGGNVCGSNTPVTPQI